MGILWDFVGNADSQASPQIYGIKIYVFTRSSDGSQAHSSLMSSWARSGLWMLMPAQLCFVSKVREREGSPKPQPVSLNHLQVSQPESFLVWCDKLSRVESALYLDKTSWKCQVRVAFSSQKTQLWCFLWIFTLAFPLPGALSFTPLFTWVTLILSSSLSLDVISYF